MIENMSETFEENSEDIVKSLMQEMLENPEYVKKLARPPAPKINSIKKLDFLDKIINETIGCGTTGFNIGGVDMRVTPWALLTFSAYQESKRLGYKGRRALDFVNSELKKCKNHIRKLAEKTGHL